MVIIKHNGGWSASNDARIETFSSPQMDNGKIKSIKRVKYCVFTNPYTVSGNLDGEVKIAIKDDVTDEVLGFDGVLENKGIRIVGQSSTEWLKNI